MTNRKILEVENLETSFQIRKNRVNVVRKVSFDLNDGEILAIVGESGSGKSVTMKSVMGILPENASVSGDKVLFMGKDILSLSKEEKRKMRGKDMAMIFQDPMTALNPLKTIGSHLIEVLVRHRDLSKKEARQEAVSILTKVGIPSPENRLKQYPHEFSGGMRQRVLIAMALSAQPKLLIADEPTTALDVTIQAQILRLLKRLSKEEQMSIILITHDLGVVASLAQRVAVMYGGVIMEEGTIQEIFKHPANPYTMALLEAIPKVNENKNQPLVAIPGTAPSLLHPLPGCPFADRCRFSSEACRKEMPSMMSYSTTQASRCIYTKDQLDTWKGEA